MKKEELQALDFKKFVALFMKGAEKPFEYSESPIQIYPLSYANVFIKAPTPLFKMEYTVLLVFTKGGGRQQVDNEFYKLQKNDVLFIREGHLNAIQSIEPDTEGFFIYLDYKILLRSIHDKNQLNKITFQPKHSLDTFNIKWVSDCLKLMKQLQNESGTTTEIKVSLLQSVFLKLLETWPAVEHKLDRSLELTLKFKEVLFQNFTQNRSVKFYADTLAVSENYLNRIVKETTNKSLKSHIHEMVIFYSQVLLQRSEFTISQVAYELNFADPSHFGRLFKKIAGMTPSAYQDSTMQGLSG